MFHEFTMLLTKSVRVILKSVKHTENGYEAYRVFNEKCDPKTGSCLLTRRQQIHKYDFGQTSEGFLDKLTAWENIIDDFNAIEVDEPIGAGVKCRI